MLIHCPRCGFEQPKDQFCAQCGVDMESYKPIRPSLWSRIFKNPLFQLSLLIVGAVLVGSTLYKKGQRSLERRVEPFSSSLQLNTTDIESTSPEAVEPPPVQIGENQAPPTTPNKDGSINAFKVADPTPGPQEAFAKSEKSEVVIYFAEVSKNALNNIVNASRNAGQYVDFNFYTAGLTPNLSKILSGSGVKVLREEKKSLETSRDLKWFYNIKDPEDSNSEIGLTILLHTKISDLEALSGNIDIQRSWREPTSSGELVVQKRSFPAEFEIDNESGFFIAGVMPRRSYLDNDQELTNIDIYKILTSPQFRAGESNFVIFIDFVNKK